MTRKKNFATGFFKKPLDEKNFIQTEKISDVKNKTSVRKWSPRNFKNFKSPRKSPRNFKRIKNISVSSVFNSSSRIITRFVENTDLKSARCADPDSMPINTSPDVVKSAPSVHSKSPSSSS
jgi:hypothetical protein